MQELPLENQEPSISWARKYRPKLLNDVLGNTLVKQRLSDMFANNRIPQALLLDGPRGCGKSSLARIVTKTILCTNRHEDGSSCEECASCTSLNQRFIGKGENSNSLQIQLVDIANFNGKDDAAKLVEQMKTPPLHGHKKVYILDEIQRATPEAQNAYLKISEEPGPHLHIIMCTTEIDNLIDPFRSRFTRMTVRRPSSNELVEHMGIICENERVSWDKSSLHLLAMHHNRIPRECLIELEAQAATGGISYDRLVESLRIVDKTLYGDYFHEVVTAEDLHDVLAFVENIYTKHDVDYTAFLEGLGAYLMDLLYLKLGIRLEQYTDKEFTAIRRLTKNISVKDLGAMIGAVDRTLNKKGSAKYRLLVLTVELIHPEFLQPVKKEELAAQAKKEYDDGVKEYVSNRDAEIQEAERNYTENEMKTEDVLSIFDGAEVTKIDADMLGFLSNLGVDVPDDSQ